MNANEKPAGTIKSTWEIADYDVWGNVKDGYEVNDVYRRGTIDLKIPARRYNVGTEQEFVSAYPTLKQIREALDIKPRIRIETDGDDLVIYVNARKDGYPLGELRCISHQSLSPIRK